LGTNFNSAILTDACIEDWQINSNTKFDDIECHSIYFQSELDETSVWVRFYDRRPSNENEFFAAGDFALLVRNSLETVDLIFRNGINWKAVDISFAKFKDENGIELEIRAIENKGNGDFVVRVDVPPDADKSAIESRLKQEYEIARNALEAQYRSQLEAKDREIVIYQQQSTNLTEIMKLMAARPITIENNNIGASSVMTDASKKVEQTFQGTVYGVAGNVEGNQYNYTSEQKQSLTEAAAEIQQLLTQLSETYPTTTAPEKAALATKAIEEIEKNPIQKAKIVKALKVGGVAAIKELVDPIAKPVVNVLLPMLEILWGEK